MNKTKAKRKPGWLNHWIRPVELDFITPESLEAAVRALNAQQTRQIVGGRRFRRFDVWLSLVDADTYRYRMTLLTGRDITVEAKGQLKRDHEDTRCTARIRIAPRFYIIGLTLSAFVVFMVASPLHSLKGLLLCGLLILAVLGVLLLECPAPVLRARPSHPARAAQHAAQLLAKSSSIWLTAEMLTG